MSFLKNLFGKDVETQADVNQNLLSHAQKLKSDFGLTRVEDVGWSFTGALVDDMVSQLSSPENCLEGFKDLKKKVPCSQVCIMVDPKKTLLVFNTKPRPIGFLSGLDSKGAADLISALIKSSGKKAFEYQGTWLLTLPR